MFPISSQRQVRSGIAVPMDVLRDELNRTVGRLWGGDGVERTLTGIYPVDIHEDDNHVYVEAELPGFKRDEVNVTIENGVLSIYAERKEEAGAKGDAHLRERRFTRVSRSFSLPNLVDENKVDAKLQDGVLTLMLNKREEVKTRRIEIK